jgi:exosortase family protein XrtG
MLILILYIVVYLLLLALFYRRQNRLLTFVTGAFGLAFIMIQLAVAISLPARLAAVEAQQVHAILSTFGISIDIVSGTTLMIPDAYGWVGAKIGIESSTVIEIAVFAGVMCFYPRFRPPKRTLFLLVGIGGTYILNLTRLLLIVGTVMVLNREAFPLVHNLAGRILYFAGVIALYWYLLTRPTLHLIHQSQVQQQEEHSS